MAAGALIAIAGIAWTLQGPGYLTSIFMTGATLCAVIGPVTTVARLALIAVGCSGARFRADAEEVDRGGAHDRPAVLIHRLGHRLDDAAIRLAQRSSRLRHRGPDTECVPRADRIRPADLIGTRAAQVANGQQGLPGLSLSGYILSGPALAPPDPGKWHLTCGDAAQAADRRADPREDRSMDH